MGTVISKADTPVEQLRVRIARLISRFPDVARVVVAYSGGRDSHTLLAVTLRALHGSGIALGALHVNHHLHADSDAWASHCASQCASLGIDCVVESVAPQDLAAGPEAAARSARYAAFEAHMRERTVMLQAHHADDQLETVLLRLMRGCGVHGVCGIPEQRRLGAGVLWRPFLAVSVDLVSQAAESLEIDWIEDPSNADARLDRNYLRHTVLPLLRARWPSAAKSVATSTANFADAVSVLDREADKALDALSHTAALPIGTLLQGPRAHSRMVLHRWIRRAGLQVPSRRALDRVVDEVALAAPDASPRLMIGDRQIRRHRGALYIAPKTAAFDTRMVIDWSDKTEPLRLPTGSTLDLESVLADGLDRRFLAASWLVKFQRGGDLLKPPGRSRASVKKLLNATGIPAWERPTLPYLYVDGELAWVQGLGVELRFRGSTSSASDALDTD